MTPDELDAAIRQELRFAARLAPDAGPVRRRVLLAAEALDPAELPPRGLRAWTVPLLAAAAVLVALVLTAAGQALRADRTPTPPAGISTGPVGPTPTAASSTAAARSTPSPSPTASPSHTAGAGTTASRSSGTRHSSTAGPSQPAGQGPIDWYRNLSIAKLPHTPGLCSQWSSPGTDASVPAPQPISVSGEPRPLWLVPITCVDGPEGDPRPQPVEVFRYSPGGPQLVQTLAYQAGDPRWLAVTALSVGPDGVTFAESGYHADHDAVCCRSLRFSQTFTWDADHFVAGPQQDVVPLCVDGQLEIAGARMGAEGGTTSGMRLTYANHSSEPCALVGYPDAAALDSAGTVLAEAARTPSGPLGDASPYGDTARIVVFDQVTAEAVVEWSTVSQAGSSCFAHATVRATMPNGTVTAAFPDEPLVCGLQVHPVR